MEVVCLLCEIDNELFVSPFFFVFVLVQEFLYDLLVRIALFYSKYVTAMPCSFASAFLPAFCRSEFCNGRKKDQLDLALPNGLLTENLLSEHYFKMKNEIR